MYAIIQSGSRQTHVVRDCIITVDRLDGKVGDEITFDEVLFVDKGGGNFLAGAPHVASARVKGVVDSQERGPKVRVFRKKRRKAWRRTLGHRTALTRVRITEIEVG